MMRKLSRFLALSGAQKLFLLRCVFVVSVVRFGLTFLSYNWLRRRVIAKDVDAPGDIEELRRVAWGVAIASRLVPRATCLTQALAGQYILAAAGRDSKIQIGIERGTGAELRAHAWLVSGDHVVLGGPATSLARFTHLIDYGR
jgi:hypothetical protein